MISLKSITLNIFCVDDFKIHIFSPHIFPEFHVSTNFNTRIPDSMWNVIWPRQNYWVHYSLSPSSSPPPLYYISVNSAHIYPIAQAKGGRPCPLLSSSLYPNYQQVLSLLPLKHTLVPPTHCPSIATTCFTLVHHFKTRLFSWPPKRFYFNFEVN